LGITSSACRVPGSCSAPLHEADTAHAIVARYSLLTLLTLRFALSSPTDIISIIFGRFSLTVFGVALEIVRLVIIRIT